MIEYMRKAIKKDLDIEFFDVELMALYTREVKAVEDERLAEIARQKAEAERKAKDEANYQMNEAIRFYKEWGAEAKFEMLKGQVGDSNMF